MYLTLGGTAHSGGIQPVNASAGRDRHRAISPPVSVSATDSTHVPGCRIYRVLRPPSTTTI